MKEERKRETEIKKEGKTPTNKWLFRNLKREFATSVPCDLSTIFWNMYLNLSVNGSSSTASILRLWWCPFQFMFFSNIPPGL